MNEFNRTNKQMAKKIKELRDELAKVNDRKLTLQGDLRKSREKVARLTRTKLSLEQANNTIKRFLRESQADNKELKKNYEGSEFIVSVLRSDLKSADEVFREQMTKRTNDKLKYERALAFINDLTGE